MKALGRGSIASIVKVGLEVLWVLFWIAAFGLAAAIGLYATIQALTAAGLIGPPEISGEVELVINGAKVRGAPHEVLTPTVVWTALAAGAAAIAGGLVVIGRLKALFANFCSNEPFNRANADHLRAIWLTLVAVEGSRFVIAGAAGTVAALSPDREGEALVSVTGPSIDLSTWTAILILIVLAEVFREGARLREDQDLTI